VLVALAATAAALTATPPPPGRPLVDPRTAAPYFTQGAFKEAADRFRNEDWKGAAEKFTAALKSRRASKTEAPRARFLLALAQSSLNNWTEAASLFERLWREDPPLRPYYAYHAAACHLRRGDPKGALTWVARVERGSVPEAEAALIRLEVLGAAKRWPEAEREGKRYAERFSEGPRSSEAAFATAVAVEAQGRVAEAADRFRRIWAESRADSWSQRAESRLNALAERLPPDQRTFTERRAQHWLARAMVLFDRHQNEASEAAFATVLKAPGLDAGIECKARYHQAQSVWKQRNRTRGAPLFAEAVEACTRAGDADMRARALYQRGRCLAMIGQKEEARAEFARLEADHPEHRLADDARLRGAEVAWDAGDRAAGDGLATTLAERYPYGDMVDEALWRLAYRSYREEQWDEARGFLAENRRLVPRASIWYAEGRAEYWEGRILEKQTRPAEAAGWYQQAVRRYPLSVYALLAFARLEEIAPASAESLTRELRRPAKAPVAAGARTRPTAPPRTTTLTVAEKAGLSRAVEFARMGLGSRTHRELARLYRTGATELNRDLTGTAALLLDRAGLWNASHSLVDDKMGEFRLWYPTGGPMNAWALAYPRAYGDLVDTSTRAHEVPPELQLALMREESAFNPRAESTANCLGLTMLKPSTARDLLSRNVSREQLLDPELNLKAGARHLASLLKRYRAVVPAIAAYNAGEGAVARWLRERGHLPVDEFLEEIPYEETRGYTKRVLASYFAYSWLYAPPKSTIPDVRLLAERER
jgi:soluble lytic murein transglycosylase